MSGPQPITRQRSPWKQLPDQLIPGTTQHARRTVDGTLLAIVGLEPGGWHMSVSFRPARAGRLARYPTWDELTHARYELMPADIDVVMHLPPTDEYVAVHDTTFHLHEHPPRDG